MEQVLESMNMHQTPCCIFLFMYFVFVFMYIILFYSVHAIENINLYQHSNQIKFKLIMKYHATLSWKWSIIWLLKAISSF